MRDEPTPFVAQRNSGGLVVKGQNLCHFCGLVGVHTRDATPEVLVLLGVQPVKDAVVDGQFFLGTAAHDGVTSPSTPRVS